MRGNTYTPSDYFSVMMLPRTGACFVISLPDSHERRLFIVEQFGRLGLSFVFSDGVMVDPQTLLWREMRDLEAYGKSAYLKNEYPARAVGCRRAGLEALKKGILTCTDGFLVCQDDAVLAEDFLQEARYCLEELPENAGLLWFDRSQITKLEKRYSEHLNINFGSRLCTCFWISADFARKIIPELEQASTEWDIFMERMMWSSRDDAVCFISKRDLAYQKQGVSLITGVNKWSVFRKCKHALKQFLFHAAKRGEGGIRGIADFLKRFF